jgi:hypothetical protein
MSMQSVAVPVFSETSISLRHHHPVRDYLVVKPELAIHLLSVEDKTPDPVVIGCPEQTFHTFFVSL